jgi:hypothetical protein
VKDLIERLEKAAGPDRQLDNAIEEAVDFPKPANPDDLPGYPPYFTASIDAALTLVPEHSTIRIANCHEGIVGGHAWVAALKNPYMSFPEIFGEFCSTPDNRQSMAVALCIAALKARAAITAGKAADG